MLAKRVGELPPGDTWVFEPKWDGFRALVFRDGDDILLQSRDQKSLNRYFPELVETLLARLPLRCVLDGEIVIATESGLDFDLLQLRIHPAASRVKLLSQQTPASIVFFDLLCEGDRIEPRDLPQEVLARKPLVRASDRVRADKFEIPSEGIDFEKFERDLIMQAMEKADWVIAKAAKLLGMSYRTLQYRLEKFGIRKPEGKPPADAEA